LAQFKGNPKANFGSFDFIQNTIINHNRLNWQFLSFPKKAAPGLSVFTEVTDFDYLYTSNPFGAHFLQGLDIA
jgi:hypothetical protein